MSIGGRTRRHCTAYTVPGGFGPGVAVVIVRLSTTAPVKILLPELSVPDAGLISITPDTVISAWHGMVTAFWQQLRRATA